MPTNLYGPGDNFNIETLHVLPAILRKMHLAKCLENNDMKAIRKDLNKYPYSTQESYSEAMTDEEIMDLLDNFGISRSSSVLDNKKEIRDNSGNSWKISLKLWGSGSPRREFLYVDDLADAVVYLMNNYSAKDIGEFVNIGTGKDLTIKELAEMVKEIVEFKGEIEWDSSKPDGTPQKLLDVGRLNELGWKNKIELEEGIEKTYDRFKSSWIFTLG